MSAHSDSVFDLAKFAKVKALHDSTEHIGERQAARRKLETMARAAGLTIEQALSKLDAEAARRECAADYWNDAFNTPEMRADRARRDAEQARNKAALLDEYGTEDAVFAECERERLLREACAHLVQRDPQHGFVSSLDGWEPWHSGREPRSVREAVSSAYALPHNVTAAWEEHSYWEKRDSDRCTFEPDYSPWPWVAARQYLLEELCDTLPAQSMADLQARVSWMEHLNDQGRSRDRHGEAAFLARLRADLAAMAGVVTVLAGIVQNGRDGRNPLRPVQSGHRTNADKRNAVLAMLKSEEGASLSDRGIARRIGVSPQTVNTWRRRTAEGASFERRSH